MADMLSFFQEKSNSTVKARFIGNQCVCGWCHFSRATTCAISIYLRIVSLIGTNQLIHNKLGDFWDVVLPVWYSSLDLGSFTVSGLAACFGLYYSCYS